MLKIKMSLIALLLIFSCSKRYVFIEAENPCVMPKPLKCGIYPLSGTKDEKIEAQAKCLLIKVMNYKALLEYTKCIEGSIKGGKNE